MYTFTYSRCFYERNNVFEILFAFLDALLKRIYSERIFRAAWRSRKGSCLVSQRSWVRYMVWPHTFVSPSADSRGAVVSYWRNYVHEVLVNRLGGLSLPRKTVVRLTDRPDMTLDVYRGRKTTTKQQQRQQQQQHNTH